MGLADRPLATRRATHIFRRMRSSPLVWFVPLLSVVSANHAAPLPPDALWARENIAAWCIVPYDAKKRGPVERARMLQRLGLRKLAYDYRDEHLPTFDAEIAAMREHGIEIVAWWFPVTLDARARHILATVQRHGIHPQLWVTGWEDAAAKALSSDQRLARETDRIRSIATAAKAAGCTVALYNHGGWFGEPENQVAIIERLRAEGFGNLGIVYNFHHGHAHVGKFAELWSKMRTYVVAVNLNGMVRDGDRRGRKIAYLGEGDHELEMLRAIARSGWQGSIGILNHQADIDAEEALRKNLAGLETLVASLRRRSN